jgi:uridine kinase
MPDNLTVYRLFVAAPSDVRSEQTVIRDVVAAWNAMNSHHVRIAFEVVNRSGILGGLIA